ncbi:MAG: hypothetical protein H7840_03000 [Alphaproteobacteria bacterium]
MRRVVFCLATVGALGGCGVVMGAADVVGTAVGTTVDVTGAVVSTTVDVVTKPLRD